MHAAEKFQERFRAWLGPKPKKAVGVLAKRTGYSRKYLLWAAGLIGSKPWPGSRRFIRKMQAPGCSTKPWRDRSAEELRRAFETREVVYEPGEK